MEKEDKKKKKKEMKETFIKVPQNKDNEYHFAIYTGEKLKIKLKGDLPLIDAHMHIQSNNTAPMTLQYGVLMKKLIVELNKKPDMIKKIIKTGRRIESVIQILFLVFLFNPKTSLGIFIAKMIYNKSVLSEWVKAIKKLLDNITVYSVDKMTIDIMSKLGRDMLNTIMPVLGDFFKIGTLDTDNVGRLFMGDMNGLEAVEYAVGLETFDKLKRIYGIDLDLSTPSKIITKMKQGDGMSTDQARKMIENRNYLYKNFQYLTKYYYDDVRIFHMNVVLPMDMGYSHYWGYFGIPIYFPKDSDNVYYVRTFTYYLSFFDQILYTKSFLYKSGKIKDNDGEKFQKRIETRVNDRLIREVKHDAREAYKKIDSRSEHLKGFTERDQFPSDVKSKVNNIKSECDKISGMLKNMENGYKTGSNGKGLNVRFKEEISDFSCNIIKEYDESLEKNKEDEDIMKSYHFVSNYIGYRLDKLEDTVRKQIGRLEDSKYFDAMEELREVIYDMRKQIDIGLMNNIKADVKYLVPKANKAAEKCKKEIDRYREIIKDLEKKINEEIDLVKKHFNVTRYGLNKIIPHNLKLSDNKDHFRIKSKRSTDWSDRGINETFNEKEEYKDMNDSKDYDKYLNRDNNLYLDQVPGKERKMYESYRIQLSRTLATGLRYAFRMLPFYHYDPRRHYTSSANLKTIKDDIKNNFAFHILTPGDMEMPRITPVEFTDQYFDTLFKQEKTSNKDAFDIVQTGSNDGICWGYKMYTELGYVPHMFDDGDRGYPLLKETVNGRYSHLKEFFEHCESNKIPITCHGSPQGMTIADTPIYGRIGKGEMKQGQSFDKMLYELKIADAADSLTYLDRICVNPDAWDRVLQKYGSLKLCLAHYGGYGTWLGKSKKELDEDLLVDWRSGVTGLIKKYQNVYTDLACFLNEEEAIPDIIEAGKYEDALSRTNLQKKGLNREEIDTNAINRMNTTFITGLHP